MNKYPYKSLTIDEVKAILNLKTSDLIATEISNRQTEVIRKAYNYLCASPKHNLVYIADEVGLGKTYVALGISVLLRHFSSNPEKHRNLVIVPKANLQKKWENDANGFLDTNYLGNKIQKQEDFITRKNQLEAISPSTKMTIVRTSSFSALYQHSRERKKVFDKIMDRLNQDAWARGILERAYNGNVFNKENEIWLRRLIAYLLNAVTGKLDCIIIDEAHNYKHGLGEKSSQRNEVTAYFLGAKKDEDLLECFPELKEKVNFPLSDKIICLSATPKDRKLKEIGNQLDCFTYIHCLQNVRAEELIAQLKTFLIRGNMEYLIQNKSESRHACRFEHRKGNIKKGENVPPLTVEDNFTGAFWQLLQYQSIKHLSAKANKTFEMGMLAGFETYQLDLKKQILTPNEEDIAENEDDAVNVEYEQTATKEDKNSQDKAVIERITQEYLEGNGELPPHPKQTPLEEELVKQMLRQEKSLVFVRRVHSASELTARLLRKYEEGMVEILKRMKGIKYRIFVNSPKFANLLKEYELREKKEKIKTLFSEKLHSRLGSDLYSPEYCFFAYKRNEEVRLELDRILDKKDLSFRLNPNFKGWLEKCRTEWQAAEKEREEDKNMEVEEQEEMDTNYFFNAYFRKGEDGFSFRGKMSKLKLYDLPVNCTQNDKQFLPQFLLSEKHCKQEFENWKKKHFEKKDWEMLEVMLKGVFRHGSGLLAGFVAECPQKGDFVQNLLLLTEVNGLFEHVCKEVKQILQDFDLIINANFKHKDLKKMKSTLEKLSPVIGRTGSSGNDRSIVAAQFRMPGFPYILIATDIFKEGEDLHTYCQNVYHYGIAWNPSDMEQRTGRIDRINSLSYRKLTEKQSDGNIFENKIHVFYPYLQHSVEVNQVAQLFRQMNKFMETFNEIDATHKRESSVKLNENVESIAQPIIPKKGKFEVEDFKEW